MSPKPETAKISEFFSEITDYENAGKLDAAYKLASRVAQATPQLAQAQNMAGLLAFHRADYGQALDWLNKAMALEPSAAAYPRNAGLVYHALYQSDAALASAQRAIDLAPEDATLYFNKALILYDCLEVNAGLEVVEQALARAPHYADAQFLKAELQLLAGRFAEGWESYECRFTTEQGKNMLPPTSKPQWDGTALAAGQLLLVADQGFGDCIQFARYIPWVAARAPAPVLAASDELLPLLRQIKGLGRAVKSWGDVGDYSAYIPLSGLPRLAGTTLDTIPAPVPYLHADPQKLSFWQDQLKALTPAGTKRVGLVWAGRPTHAKDKRRSVGLAQLAPLLARKDLVFISLQKGERAEEAGTVFADAPFLNLGPRISDFNDTLAILQTLDHLVSVDTSVAHLAGAAGVPTSLILPYAPDWRWLLNRYDSPWYPTIQLCRQHRPGDWREVVHHLAATL